jgi:hypothetical protein
MAVRGTADRNVLVTKVLVIETSNESKRVLFGHLDRNVTRGWSRLLVPSPF